MRKIFLITLFFSHFFALPLFAQTDTAWVRIYSGPYNWDSATEIAVDNSGNVYVTGHSMRNDNTMDYATLKYYPNGDTAWVRRYNGPADNGPAGPNDLAIDDSGNVYVTGYSPDTIYEQWYATIKYYPNGDTAWVRRYHGKGYGYDTGISMAVDDSLNVYVTGASSGNGTYDYGTIKYYPDGDTAWVRLYDGPAGYDVPYDLEIDHSGNIYITGISYGGSTNYDYATVKYYQNGDTGWVRRYNGPENKLDHPFALAVDDSGNVYVTGHSNYDETNFDYVTIKYYPNGDTAWVRRYDGAGYYMWPVMAVAVDSKGSVYVTGSLYGNGSNRDYTTIKYYPDGALAWVRRYNGTGNSDDYAKDLTIDNSDNLYVTGYSKNLTDTYDITTVKYSQDGSAYCARKYNTGTSGADIDYNAPISVDNTQNVYVAGETGPNFVTIKYFPIILVGDANSDGSLNVSDLVYLINYLFKGGSAPNPLLLADLNNDEYLTVSDVIYLINYLFKGGPSPIC
jgi:hypothetical protein